MSVNVPQYIIVHDTDSPGGSTVVVRKLHTDPIADGGRGWHDIGYNYVVENGWPGWGGGAGYDAQKDGLVVAGRPEDQWGAHCQGYNERSIGVCIVGPRKDGEPYSARQMKAAIDLVNRLRFQYQIPVYRVLGHRETLAGMNATPPKKDPRFDMDAFRGSLAFGFPVEKPHP
jgi:N-acetylmuramoyl-L-alanine amidase